MLSPLFFHKARDDTWPTSLVNLSCSFDCLLHVTATGHVALRLLLVTGNGLLDDELLKHMRAWPQMLWAGVRTGKTQIKGSKNSVTAVPKKAALSWGCQMTPPLKNSIFLKLRERTLRSHGIGCSELKGWKCLGQRRVITFAVAIVFHVWVFLPSVGNVGWCLLPIHKLLPALKSRSNDYSCVGSRMR